MGPSTKLLTEWDYKIITAKSRDLSVGDSSGGSELARRRRKLIDLGKRRADWSVFECKSRSWSGSGLAAAETVNSSVEVM
jgi:hypothetical protein